MMIALNDYVVAIYTILLILVGYYIRLLQDKYKIIIERKA